MKQLALKRRDLDRWQAGFLARLKCLIEGFVAWHQLAHKVAIHVVPKVLAHSAHVHSISGQVAHAVRERPRCRSVPDAVVIGAGHNGLVAANILADEGWEVLVLETSATPGGAVKTAEITVPGYRHDLFSAFYPLAAASGVIRSLELERHGLVWCHAAFGAGA